MSTLFLALVIAAPATKGDSKPMPEHPLLGEWVVEEEVSSGKPILKIGKQATVTITRDRWKFRVEGEGEWGLSVEPKKDPPQIDLWDPARTDEKTVANKGIYKLDGDTLIIYYSYSERPTKFESLPKSGVRMMTLRRVKKN
jgi:uncharacterized protein (TIGR03067 family)